MNVIDYDLIEDLSILFGSNVILYGTGFWSEKVFFCLQENDIRPDIVCKTEKTTDKFHGLQVEALSDVCQKYDDERYLLIVASVERYKEMIDMCACFKKTKICTLYGFFTSLKIHIGENILSKRSDRTIKAGMMISQDLFFPTLKTSSINRFVQAALAPEDYIWIFQPGKVGSQSIWNSIQDKSIQFHTLASAYRFRDIEKKYLDHYLHLIQKKKIKIISAVREPISRDIAAFFQNSDIDLWPYHKFNCNIFLLCGMEDEPNVYMNLEELKIRCPLWEGSLDRSFEKLTHAIMRYKQDVFSWFDYEIKSIFGIDVYQYPFDQEKGYTIIKEGNIQILIIKMEHMSSLEKVIGDFIQDEDYRLIDRNKASEKMYSYTYERFKDRIEIPEDYFGYYYKQNPRYEHFYSRNEIEAQYRYWKRFVRENR